MVRGGCRVYVVAGNKARLRPGLRLQITFWRRPNQRVVKAPLAEEA